MVAFIGFSFGWIDGGATVGVYLHGFPANQFAGIDVRAHGWPFPLPSGLQAVIDVEAKTVGQHVDGTLAHTIRVTNKSVSGGAPALVNIAVLLEPLV